MSDIQGASSVHLAAYNQPQPGSAADKNDNRPSQPEHYPGSLAISPPTSGQPVSTVQAFKENAGQPSPREGGSVLSKLA